MTLNRKHVQNWLSFPLVDWHKQFFEQAQLYSKVYSTSGCLKRTPLRCTISLLAHSVQNPLGHQLNAEVDRVAELLLPGGNGWDVAKMKETFFDVDLTTFWRYPYVVLEQKTNLHGTTPKTGSLVWSRRIILSLSWSFFRQGKRAHLWLEDHKGWLALWAAEVPNKVKVHAWRLAKKDLAVGSETLRRKIKLGVRCVVCSRDETWIHHFWTCPHAARTWEIIRVVQATAPGFSYQGAQLQRFVELVAGLDRQSTGARPCVGLMTVYQLWLARNYKRDTARIEDPQVIVKRATFLVEEWMGPKSASNGANGSPVVEQWCPPGEGRHIWLSISCGYPVMTKETWLGLKIPKW